MGNAAQSRAKQSRAEQSRATRSDGPGGGSGLALIYRPSRIQASARNTRSRADAGGRHGIGFAGGGESDRLDEGVGAGLDE